MSEPTISPSPWTAEQQEAITANGQNLLVSAAAGSGKTAVLVERILRLCSEKSAYGTDIDKLLVVTFTKAAAAEMKSRLRAKLTQLLSVQADSAHLQKQLTLLGQASISTIDALCQRIVRENFMSLDIDPSFQVADASELEFLENEAMDEVFEQQYKENPEFPALVESFCERADDIELRELILQIHKFLETERDPAHWLREKCNIYRLTGENLAESYFGKAAFSFACEDIADAYRHLQKALTAAEAPGGPAAYIPCLENELEMAERLSGCTDYQQLSEAFSACEFARLPGAKKSETDEALIALAQDHRNQAKELLNRLRKEFFFKPAAQMAQDLLRLSPILEALSDTVRLFSHTLMQYKKERRLLSFADIKLLCYQTLVQDGVFTDAAREYRKKFDYVMIDEYQDTNDVEEGILDAVSRNADGLYNRFMVGDVKQSIYRFRHSKPQLFNEKSLAYAKGAEPGGRVITLHRNFRSRPLILHGINYIFSQIMNVEAAEIDYDKDAELTPGADYGQMPDAPVEICLIETYREDVAAEPAGDSSEDAEAEAEKQELKALEAEALYIADKITECIYEKKLTVKDGNLERPARFSDIAILMRAGKKKGATVMAALASKGIPAFSEGKVGYFLLTEISDILSLLQVIDNPLQEIPLIALLSSAIYKFTPEDLLAIRNHLHQGPFYDALYSYAHSPETAQRPLGIRCADFLNQLSLYRKKSAEMPVSQLLIYLYDHTGYLLICGAMENGKLRQANLFSLLNIARDFEKSKLENLFHFIRYIERLREGNSLGAANAIDDHADVVRIMTIHKSKGLEFPIVFLAACGGGLNTTDANDRMLLHSELGYGAQYFDYQARTKSETLPKRVIRRRLRHEALAEELRLLYVAMTRARERLIITGIAGKDSFAALQKWHMLAADHGATFSKQHITRANSYLDFIMPPLLRHPDIAASLADWGLAPVHAENEYAPLSHFMLTPVTLPLFQAMTAVRSSSLSRAEAEQLLRRLEKEPPQNGAFEVDKLVDWQYNYQVDVENPVKISISEIKTQFQNAIWGNLDSPPDSPLDSPAVFPPVFPTGTQPSPGQPMPAMDAEILFARPQFMLEGKKLSAAETGTAIHTVLSAITFGQTETAEDVAALLAHLRLKNILTAEEAAVIPVDAIVAFAQSEIAQRVAHAQMHRKEAPFVIGLPPGEVYLPPSEDIVLVHGIVDCYFEEEDGIVILDYKTDRLSSGGYSALIEQYQLQMDIYAKAVAMITAKPIKESYLYLVRYQKLLAIQPKN